jgi:hypothetical protein
MYRRERQPRPLGDLDDGDAPQDVAAIAALVAGGSPALDQFLRLVEVQLRDRHPAARRHVADAELSAQQGMASGTETNRTEPEGRLRLLRAEGGTRFRGPSRPAAARLLPFLLHYTRPVLPWLVVMSLLTAPSRSWKIALIGMMGQLVDWLASADRDGDVGAAGPEPPFA